MHDDSLDDALDAARQPRSGVRVFNLFSKRAFDYSFLGISTTSITLHRALNVPPFYYYWLGLRIHNRDIVDGTFTLQLFQTLPSGQDPQEFSAASPSLSLKCIPADTPPTLKVTTLQALGPYFKVALEAAQGIAGARFYAELSAVLYARPA
jgi:hypothetical protein